MYKAFLFDFDGVLRHWPQGEQTATTEGTDIHHNQVLKTAFNPELLNKAVTGVISDQQWRDEVRATLSQEFETEAAALAVARWSALQGQICERMLSLCELLREKAQVALVTNATSRLRADLRFHQLTHAFDWVFNSSEMGVAKPDRLFFQQVLTVMEVEPEQAFLIDDSYANVRSAELIGSSGFHYSEPDTFSQLQQLL